MLRQFNVDRSLVLNRLVGAFFVLVLVASFPSTSFAASVTDHVVINEIMANPASGEKEWVELYNPTSTTVDVSGWRIKNGTANFSNVFGSGTTIASHSFLLREATSTSSQLNNTTQTLSLQDTSLVHVDDVTYTGIIQSKSYARIFDAADEWNAKADPTKSATNGVKDETGPEIVLNGQTPDENEIVADTIKIQANVSDTSSLDRVEIGVRSEDPVDDTILCTDSSPLKGAKLCDIDTIGLSDGTQTVFVKAYDSEGNATSVERSIIVDNTAPVLQLTVPEHKRHGTLTLMLSVDEANVTSAMIRILDSEGHEVANSSAASNLLIYDWDSDEKNGTYTIEYSARDAVGHETTDSTTLTVDNIKPSASLTPLSSPVGGTTDKVTIAGEVSDDSGNVSYTLKIEGETVDISGSPFSYDWNISSLPSGQYEIKLTAEDGAGNTMTDSQTIVIDNSAPTITIDTPFVNATSLSGTISENRPIKLLVGSEQLDVSVSDVENGDGNYNWTASIPSSLKNGTYTVIASATDALGNTSSDMNTEATATLVLDRVVSTPPLKTVSIKPLSGVEPLSVVGSVKPSFISIKAADGSDSTQKSAITTQGDVLAATSDASDKHAAVDAFGIDWYWWVVALAGAGGTWFLIQRFSNRST